MLDKTIVWILVLVSGAYGLTIISRETVDLNVDGFIDHIRITFNESVNDGLVDDAVRNAAFQTVEYVVNITQGWITGLGLNDSVGMFALVTNLSCDTSATPGVFYTALSATPIPGLVSDVSPVPALDKADPIIIQTFAVSDNGDPFLWIRFSEPVMDRNQTEVILSDFTFFPGDAVPPFETTFMIGLADDYGIDKNVILIGDTGFASPSDVTSSISSSNNSLMIDAVGNNVTRIAVAVAATGTGIALLPTWQYMDLNSNGIIDTIRLNFNMPLRDRTVSPLLNSFIVFNPTRVITGNNTGIGDQTVLANDQFYYFTVQEGLVYDTSIAMTVVTTGFPTDTPGACGWRAQDDCPAPATISFSGRWQVPTVPSQIQAVTDIAPAIPVSVIALDTNSNGKIDTILVDFSENVLDSSTVASDWTVTDPYLSIQVMGTAVRFNDTRLQYFVQESSIINNNLQPTVTYSKYFKTFLDWNGNAMQIRSIGQVVPEIVAAVGFGNTLTVTFSAIVGTQTDGTGALSNTSFFCSFANVTSISGGNTTYVLTLDHNVTTDGTVQVNTNLYNNNGTLTLTTPFAVTFHSYNFFANRADAVNPVSAVQSPADTDTQMFLGNNLGQDTYWNGAVNLIAVKYGTLSTSDFDQMVRYAMQRLSG